MEAGGTGVRGTRGGGGRGCGGDVKNFALHQQMDFRVSERGKLFALLSMFRDPWVISYEYPRLYAG